MWWWWWWRIKVCRLLSSSQSAGVNKSTNICKQWCTCFLSNKHSCSKQGPGDRTGKRAGISGAEQLFWSTSSARPAACVYVRVKLTERGDKDSESREREDTNHPVIIPPVCELPNSPSLIDSPDPITQHTATMDWGAG